MSEKEDFDKAFRNERFGPGAGMPTSLGGTLGQMSAQQQRDLAEGRVQAGASGALLLEMIRGGMISRGILILIAGFALAVGGVNGTPGSWFVPVGFLGGRLLMLLGVGMVVIGTIRRIIRAFRQTSPPSAACGFRSLLHWAGNRTLGAVARAPAGEAEGGARPQDLRTPEATGVRPLSIMTEYRGAMFSSRRKSLLCMALALSASACAAAQASPHAAVVAALNPFPYDPAVSIACASDRTAVPDSITTIDILLDSLSTAGRAEVLVDAGVRYPRVPSPGSAPLSFSYSPPESSRNLGTGCTLSSGATLRMVARQLGGGQLRFVSNWPVRLRIRDGAGLVLSERTYYSRAPGGDVVRWGPE